MTLSSDDIGSGESETLDDFVRMLIRSSIEALSRLGIPVKAGRVFDRAAPEGMNLGIVLNQMVKMWESKELRIDPPPGDLDGRGHQISGDAIVGVIYKPIE